MARVLIVDSDAESRATTARLVQELGHNFEEAPDGGEAFEQLLAVPFDLVVSEAVLPKLDSPALIEKMKSRGVKTPVLIFSSATKASCVAALMRLGILEYIHKSTPLGVVKHKLAAVLAPRAAPPTVPLAPAPPTPVAMAPVEARSGIEPTAAAGPTDSGVLVVDKLPDVHDKLRLLLPTSIELDGAQAVDAALAHAARRRYRMVLFDSETSLLNLSGLVAQFHRLQPEAFIVGMASVERGNAVAVEASLRSLGFDDVLLKPIEPQALGALVAQYCASYEQLVSLQDDVIRISRLRCRETQLGFYVGQLRTRTKGVLTTLCDACIDTAFVDFSEAQTLPLRDFAEILVGLGRRADELSLRLFVVVAPRVLTSVQAVEEARVVRCFNSMDSARSAAR